MTWSESALADVGEAEALIDDVFKNCDRDSNGVLCFAEVAALFKQLSPEQSSESAANAAVEALLLVDADADQQLDRAEFGRLLAKVSEVAELPLLEAAHKLLESTQQQQASADTQRPAAAADSSQTPASKQTHQSPTVAEDSAAPAAAAGVIGEAGLPDANSKLLALFELWDKTGDGRITFEELCQGLAKFQPAKSKQDVLSLLRQSASALAAHDANDDRQLDFAEFAGFMGRFMSAAGYKLEAVLDELLLLAATKPDSKKLQRLLDEAHPQIEQLLAGKE